MALLIEDALGRLGDGGETEALVWRDGIRTEREFAAAVGSRAGHFRTRGLKPGDRVLISLPKGPVAVECLFATLACGGIAVPVDPSTPPERLRAILSEIAPFCILADGPLDGVTPGEPVDRLQLDPFAAGQGGAADGFAPVSVSGDDVALVLMTSGSTGTPKGIAITHANITAFSDWAIASFGLTAADRFISIAPLHFDLSVLDILTSRRIGAMAYLADRPETLFPGQLTEAIETHRISILYTVPTALRLMHSHGGLAARSLGALRWIFYAGEVYPPRQLAALMADVPTPRYANLYGPTETNVICCDLLDGPPTEHAPPSIGRPCSHSEISICDQSGGRVETGERGEICVAGPTVMAGYWRRPDLTRSCYFEGDGTVFRTGDLGFTDEQGAIRFLGRRDRQVKIRGHRVELPEIEAVALASGLVDSAAATVADPGENNGSLWLHVGVEDGSHFDPSQLNGFLADRLTGPSMPDRICARRRMPVTPTGKLDLAALQAEHHAMLGAAEEPA
ncbi:MAG: AMP-binding protein [Sphingomonadales bacterium]|nr:AMP-binding protein [Sphingomonadales bacterium]